MKKFFLCLGILCLLGILNTGASATLYTGSISSVNGLFGNGSWASNATLSWLVDDTTHEKYWTYEYTFSVAEKDISHVITELSQDFKYENIIGLSSSFKIEDGWTPAKYDPNSASNPGLPSSIYGLKLDLIVDIKTFVWTIVSDKSPMWGDFYAKSGNNNGGTYSYNSGFGIDTNDAIDNGNAYFFDSETQKGYAWVLVPDTQTTMVPEPATMLLLGFGLMGMAFIGRRRFRK